MAKPNPTIEDLRRERRAFAEAISQMVEQFKTEHGVAIERIDLSYQTFRDSSERPPVRVLTAVDIELERI